MASSTAESPATVSPRQALWLVGACTTASIPMLPELPVWLAGLVGGLLLSSAAIWWRGGRLPPRWLVLALMLVAIGATAVAYRSIFGREPGVAMLLAFLGLKLMELRTVRDGMTAVLLCYFLQLALFFDNQGPEVAAYAVANLVLITAAIVKLNHDDQPASAVLRRAAAMIVQAVPFMLVFFVLFPRVQGPLWGMPRDAYAGLSGLSDSMAPGSISQLSLSGALAFRVKFDGAAPPQRDLYWRGPVLTRFDGRTWHTLRTGASDRLPYEPGGVAVEYVVTIEPHDRPWLLALDLPGRIPPDAQIASDYQLLSKTPIRSRQRHPMTSYPDTVAGIDERKGVLGLARYLPHDSNPRARVIAREWRREAPDDAALIRIALEYFRRQPFVYTLSPPLLGDNGIDEFLFDTRRGFCEHFAGAFVFLMRAAGLPARVVTGYQGGEVNPVDGYLLVRQSDAHAWAEVWLAGRGWTRVDPTAAVAPNRIERGVVSALPEGDPLPFMVRTNLDWIRKLRFQWEALGNSWDQWVIGYNSDRQREVLTRLGMKQPDWQSMAASMAALTGAIMLGLAAWTIRQRARLDPAQRAWRLLSRKLSRVGLRRRPDEGPMAYSKRIRSAQPGLAEETSAIAGLYAAIRYGRDADASLQRDLMNRVRRLRIAQ